MATYTLYNRDPSSPTRTDDPQIVKAHALKVAKRRLTVPSFSKVLPLPRLTLPTLKPQNQQTVYRALEADIAKSNKQIAEHVKETYPIGKRTSDGYYLVATDGHRALLSNDIAGDRSEDMLPDGFTPGDLLCVLDEQVALAWRRVSVCANGWIDVALSEKATPCGGHLTLSTSSQEPTHFYPEDVEATEDITLAKVYTTLTAPIRLNPKYVAPVLRATPLEMYWGGTVRDPVIFAPPGAGWRYVVMGIRS